MSPREGLFILGSVFLTTLVSVGTYRSNRLLRELGALPFNPLLAPAENGLKLVLLALLILLGRLSGLSPRSFGLVPITFDDVVLGLLAGVIGWATGNLVAGLAVARWGRGIVSSLVIRAIVPRARQEWPAVAIAMALSVLLEEVLFRSILLGGLGHWIPPVIIVPVAGILFGLLHSIQGKLGVIVASALGIGLSLLFLWHGSIWPPLVAHYVINMCQVILASHKPEVLDA